MADIGAMDRVVAVVKPVSGKTAMGGPQKAFAHLFSARASRRLVTESEEVVNRRFVVGTRYRYRMHKRSGVNETAQLVDQDVTYNILSVEPAGLLFIEILAERVTE